MKRQRCLRPRNKTGSESSNSRSRCRRVSALPDETKRSKQQIDSKFKVMTQGVTYSNSGDSRRAELRNYGDKPPFRDFRKGAALQDAVGLRPVDRAALELQTPTTIGAKYGIGFEVEKERFSRSVVREYPLLCGFERDGSCGWEAVTNILPLLPACNWRTKIYDLMHQAERVIDDQWSRSTLNCGGHVSVSVEGMSGDELMMRMRPLSGIILALYRGRLLTAERYMAHNWNMLPRQYSDKMIGYNGHNGAAGKYSLANPRSESLEYRLPSRITSVRSMRLRYELMYVLVDGAVKVQTEAQVRRRYTPIIRAMYDDVAKADRVIELSKHFDKFIMTGKVNAKVLPWVDPRCNIPEAWTRCAKRLWREHSGERDWRGNPVLPRL